MARHLTPELASKLGKMGGRPKGVLSPKTIEKMKTQEMFVEVIREKAGTIADQLLQNLIYNKDTSAGKELLDRAFGKAPQAIDMRVATFSLKDLAEYRQSLKNPPPIEPSNPPEKKDE